MALRSRDFYYKHGVFIFFRNKRNKSKISIPTHVISCLLQYSTRNYTFGSYNHKMCKHICTYLKPKNRNSKYAFKINFQQFFYLLINNKSF